MKRMSKIVLFMSLFAFKSYAGDKKPWVYLDLGDTIVNTKDMKHIKYMPGAKEYIEDLKREGFKVGIISNIPEEWGLTYEQKLMRLKDVIASGWDDTSEFDWSAFEQILLPLKDEDMKPAPTLFLEAIEKANSCPSLYIGESPKEIVAAKAVGMAAKLYEVNKEGSLIQSSDVKNFLADNYKRQYDKECLE
ncbi:HAD family hydrolase [Bacteriovorax stolpii]|uniref:HAD family hydrolase n=1 Tax=Bacteriovorax stolpii TaxID=960 RepID=UPI00163C6662|nr:HAD hydrolase-like protein [Bacteriovorax stolpii]